MSSRKITVYSTQTNKKSEVNTDVATWAELQAVMTDAGITHEGLTATENRTKTNLSLGAAVLPEGEFVLFLSPSTKIKSGTSWRDMSYNDIRKHATSIGVSGLGTTAEIGQRIENWEKTNKNTSSSNDILNTKFPTVAAKLDAFIKHTDKQFAEVSEAVNNSDYFDNTPFGEDDNSNLANEAASLGL